MAASPAEPLPFGCHMVCDGHVSGPASYDGTGRRYVLVTPNDQAFIYALDVERSDLPAPEALSRVLGPQAIRRWGEIEVLSKLLNLPAHLMLRRVLAGEGPALMAEHRVQIARADRLDLFCVIGRMPFG